MNDEDDLDYQFNNWIYENKMKNGISLSRNMESTLLENEKSNELKLGDVVTHKVYMTKLNNGIYIDKSSYLVEDPSLFKRTQLHGKKCRQYQEIIPDSVFGKSILNPGGGLYVNKTREKYIVRDNLKKYKF